MISCSRSLSKVTTEFTGFLIQFTASFKGEQISITKLSQTIKWDSLPVSPRAWSTSISRSIKTFTRRGSHLRKKLKRDGTCMKSNKKLYNKRMLSRDKAMIQAYLKLLVSHLALLINLLLKELRGQDHLHKSKSQQLNQPLNNRKGKKRRKLRLRL